MIIFNNFKFVLNILIIKYLNGDWGLGIGDWGLGVGGLAPIPNPQPQTPNSHPPF